MHLARYSCEVVALLDVHDVAKHATRDVLQLASRAQGHNSQAIIQYMLQIVALPIGQPQRQIQTVSLSQKAKTIVFHRLYYLIGSKISFTNFVLLNLLFIFIC